MKYQLRCRKYRSKEWTTRTVDCKTKGDVFEVIKNFVLSNKCYDYMYGWVCGFHVRVIYFNNMGFAHLTIDGKPRMVDLL
jgi:hypothetical protein